MRLKVRENLSGPPFLIFKMDVSLGVGLKGSVYVSLMGL